MKAKNLVFIACSLDGYIAGKNAELDWLHQTPNPENNDMGYSHFMDKIDALVMGKNTFATVCGFEGEWPYNVPVFVLSRTLNAIPEKFQDKAELLQGELNDVLKTIHAKGFKTLYIDGGATINSFLKADLIDEMTITSMPILLGGGTPLFKELPQTLNFSLIKSHVFLGAVVQSTYRRKRS